MEKINRKLENMNLALKSLHKAVDIFQKNIKQKLDRSSDQMLMVQDSLIQRFEYNTDLLWKVLKVYLEDVEKVTLETNSPRGIVRASVTAKVLSEKEGTQVMDMVVYRNKTSHIYHEEIASEIANEVPRFYTAIKLIVDRLSQKVNY